MDADTVFLISAAQGTCHRERLERLDDLFRVTTFCTRLEAAIRVQVAFARIDIDYQKNAAEKSEQLIEFGEHLLEEKIVGLDDENGASGAVAKLASQHVVTEIHPAIQPGGIDEDGARFAEIMHWQLHVDPADRFGKMSAWIELLAAQFRGMFYLAVKTVKPHLASRFIFITGHSNDEHLSDRKSVV